MGKSNGAEFFLAKVRIFFLLSEQYMAIREKYLPSLIEDASRLGFYLLLFVREVTLEMR